MKEIIPPVPRELIEAELTAAKFHRKTNKAENEIYILTHHDSPNIMREIGRLRELTFRSAGGGVGEEVDIDHYDTREEHPYKQLIVWDPSRRERYWAVTDISIVQAFRATKTVKFHWQLHTFFRFSDEFIDDYLPYIIELGRSFVQPDYQSSKAGAKALFALDNLWDGLGALMIDYPDIRYYFGKVTMYTQYNQDARNLILHFFEKFFPDPDGLVRPKKPMPFNTDSARLDELFSGKKYDEAYKILSAEVRKQGENIPPLINAYMSLTPSMRTFGTVISDEFGDVEETGILLDIDDMYDTKIDRHVSTYLEELADKQGNPKVRFQ